MPRAAVAASSDKLRAETRCRVAATKGQPSNIPGGLTTTLGFCHTPWPSLFAQEYNAAEPRDPDSPGLVPSLKKRPMAIRRFNRKEFEAVLPTVLTPTTPIRSVEFLRGREKILEVIRRSFIQPGRHVFIHGDRGVGKTSLAQTAALEHQSANAPPIFVGCDKASTFYNVARNIALKLRPIDPAITKTTSSGKLGAGWKVLSAEAQKTIERGPMPDFKTIDDAVGAIGHLAARHSQSPVIVIDEFERIKEPDERMFFADFIKQIGDQSLSVKLIFCGIGSALSDLLDAHHSCYGTSRLLRSNG
jgi:Cdc6-like AAA superfamily ATPase